jgi:hypothetical protein
MSERVPAQNKTSATPHQATQASSSLWQQNPFTSGLSESLGDNSNISRELGGIQPKTIRRSLNWQNISVEAPFRSAGRSLPGGIQLLQEEPSAVSGDRVSADSAQKSALESSNSTIPTDELAQKSSIARAPFNGRNIPVEAPPRSAVSSAYPKGIQHFEDNKDDKEARESEAVEISFSMQGYPHTLTLTSGPDAKVKMASANPDLLSAKISTAMSQLKQHSSNEDAAERREFLEQVKTKAETVENILKNNKRKRSETTVMRAEGAEIARKLSEYARKYNATDIGGILNIYPPPKVGTHGQLTGEKPLADGTTRESHHAPPVQLALSIANQLRTVAPQLKSINPDAEEFLISAVETLTAVEKGHGKDLPAILVHHITHKNAGDGGFAIHSVGIRDPLAQFIKARSGDPAKMVTMENGDLASNPKGEDFDRFFKQQRYSKKYETGNLIDADKKEFKKELMQETWRLVNESYDKVAEQTLGAVELAVLASKVDGKEADRKGAIRNLRSEQQELWRKLFRSIFPS